MSEKESPALWPGFAVSAFYLSPLYRLEQNYCAKRMSLILGGMCESGLDMRFSWENHAESQFAVRLRMATANRSRSLTRPRQPSPLHCGLGRRWTGVEPCQIWHRRVWVDTLGARETL